MSSFSKWAAGFAVLAGAAFLLDETPEGSGLALAFVWLVATSVFLGEYDAIAKEADGVFGTTLAAKP